MAAIDIDEDTGEKIEDIEVEEEMASSFLEYAYSVIYSRALPDARDGLKPVQRRILFSMNDMGIRPDRPHVKSARVVGQVMGVLHPHGDGAIYDALVRMAQHWSLRLPLIDGHGNFGSLDAGPAAMRYTECRMAPAALAMTQGLDEDMVDFRPNYDGKESEPVVLPAAFPNLLVNGATGIAVGMATNMAPHNLIEVVHGLKHLLENPDASIQDLMKFIPGPDLPTGGKIMSLTGVSEAYATGRGSFKIRASARIEQVTPRRKGIVVTELPYQIGPEKIMEQIKALVDKKTVVGVSDIKDLTDLTHGLRLVIEVKNGINPEALLEQLYKHTKLEDSFSINAVALVDGQPRTLTLKELLQVYLDHRREVTLRRTRFQLNKAQDRLHLVEGLLVAILDIDDVIAIIRSSDDAAVAKARLIDAFELSEIQATYILDMQLRRLTKLSRIELESERDDLVKRMKDLEAIVNQPELLTKVIADELDQVARDFGTPRRTVLLSDSATPTSAAQSSSPMEVPDVPCWVVLSTTGLIARIDTEDTPGDTGARSAHDCLASVIRSRTRSQMGVLTSQGRCVRLGVIELPAIPLTSSPVNLQGGVPLKELLSFHPQERPVGLTTLDESTSTWALGTRNGVVKRTNPEILGKDFWEIIRLDDGDEVVGGVELRDESMDLVFLSSDSSLLRFPATKVRPQGRTGGGMAGISLAPGCSCVFFGAVIAEESQVVTVAGSSRALPGTDAGSVKVTACDLYPRKGRATSGVRSHRFLKGEDILHVGWVGPAPSAAAASSGTPIDLPSEDPRRDGSGKPAPQPIAGVGTRRVS
ncbi:MAG: DNA topoisomerase IV subunit A [Propionibacteriaceae bacterium]|nr:DNA topoisomerase IV subunit A [Propionibacteriaceae bacterium]